MSAQVAGWYDKGIAPGQPGSAVIAGHLDTMLGTAGIFWHLQDLQAGDALQVQMSDHRMVYFTVRASRAFSVNHAPLQRIFAGTGASFLNLITCAGRWTRSDYDKRFVVFAERIPGPPDAKTP